jgi:hypothetical protein
MKSTLLFTALVCFLFATMPKVLASPEDKIDEAVGASKGWVAQIDAGQYDDSYAAGSGALHERVAQDRWGLILKTLRTPWGPVVNRTQVSHVYKPNGFEGSEGEYMVITYDTSFQHLSPATEIVVLKWEDGKWRGAGYNAMPKPSDDASANEPPNSTTEVQTQEHVKPPPQQ